MAELGIGRTPLREAVKRLALEGFVAVQPRRGTYVTDVDAAEIVHITELRAELEAYAAALAARRMDAATRRAAEALLEQVERLGREDDHEALMQVDRRIHAFVWAGVRQPVPGRHARALLLALAADLVRRARPRPGLGHAVHDQAELLRALADRDAQRAQALMREHVLAFQREILAAFSRSLTLRSRVRMSQ